MAQVLESLLKAFGVHGLLLRHRLWEDVARGGGGGEGGVLDEELLKLRGGELEHLHVGGGEQALHLLVPLGGGRVEVEGEASCAFPAAPWRRLHLSSLHLDLQNVQVRVGSIKGGAAVPRVVLSVVLS